MPTLPTITVDGNASTVYAGPFRLEFSYRTLIGYSTADKPCLTVSENVWGPTTGKHLNALDGGDKKSRLARDEFERQAAEDLGQLIGVLH